MGSKFTRTIENFTCAHCAQEVIGNGYTNHCPQCLWSKHVDVNPGDRAEQCGGMMKPIGVTIESKGWKITHQCETCGCTRKVKSAKSDSTTELVNVNSTISLNFALRASKQPKGRHLKRN